MMEPPSILTTAAAHYCWPVTAGRVQSQQGLKVHIQQHLGTSFPAALLAAAGVVIAMKGRWVL
jgi:hypothetical protein